MKRLLIPMLVLVVISLVVTACGTTATTTATTAPNHPAPTITKPTTTTPGVTVPTTTKPAATTPAATTPGTSKYGGTLRVIENAPPGPPIGAEWEGNLGTYNTQQWALERLLKEKLDGTMQAELVETWEVTATGATPNVLFHLRKGVKFSDGSDWNAKALAWNLQNVQGWQNVREHHQLLDVLGHHR